MLASSKRRTRTGRMFRIRTTQAWVASRSIRTSPDCTMLLVVSVVLEEGLERLRLLLETVARHLVLDRDVHSLPCPGWEVCQDSEVPQLGLPVRKH
jgi:hypothetical protein